MVVQLLTALHSNSLQVVVVALAEIFLVLLFVAESNLMLQLIAELTLVVELFIVVM